MQINLSENCRDFRCRNSKGSILCFKFKVEQYDNHVSCIVNDLMVACTPFGLCMYRISQLGCKIQSAQKQQIVLRIAKKNKYNLKIIFSLSSLLQVFTQSEQSIPLCITEYDSTYTGTKTVSILHLQAFNR